MSDEKLHSSVEVDDSFTEFPTSGIHDLGTIDLGELYEYSVTESGTFDFRGMSTTSLGQLLQSLPIPALLVDESQNIAYANRSWNKIIPDYKHLQGKPFASLFPHAETAARARELLKKAFSTSRQQATEALLKVGGSKVWSRINFRTIRMGQHKLILLLIEDLTLVKKQLMLNMRHRSKLLRANDHLTHEIAQRRLAEDRLKKSFERLESVLDQTGIALATAAEMRDPYIAGHQWRVAELASAIAREMHFTEDEIRGVWVSGTLHDIGKLCVPAEILSRPGDLTELEFAMIKTHPRSGHDILKGIEFSWPVAEIVLQHHERMDGTGYPDGLQGDQILVESRILAVADVVEAMSSHRPYRPANGKASAVEEVEKNKGRLYDKDVVDALVALANKGFELERQ